MTKSRIDQPHSAPASKGSWRTVTPGELGNLAPEILALIEKAYEEIGGHFEFRELKDVRMEDGLVWELIDLDDDASPDALNVKRITETGSKLIATGHDGTEAAKSAVVRHKANALKRAGHYIEVCGKLLTVLLRQDVPRILDEATVRRLLPDREITWLGDGTYLRTIAGNPCRKMMLGVPG